MQTRSSETARARISSSRADRRPVSLAWTTSNPRDRSRAVACAGIFSSRRRRNIRGGYEVEDLDLIVHRGRGEGERLFQILLRQVWIVLEQFPSFGVTGGNIQHV